MHSFYGRKPQKHKKDSQIKQLFALFALLGSEGVKAARKHVDEIDPWCIATARFEKLAASCREEMSFGRKGE